MPTFEQAPLPVCHTMAKLGIPRATFYRWYDRHSRGGPEALDDQSPRPDHFWNRSSDGVRQRIIQLALDELENSRLKRPLRFPP
jgi:putative transposase